MYSKRILTIDKYFDNSFKSKKTYFYSQHQQLQHLNQDRARHLLVQLQDHEPVGEPAEPAGDDEADPPGGAGGGAPLDQY